eukprot:4371888-Amphidinium_carterae.1
MRSRTTLSLVKPFLPLIWACCGTRWWDSSWTSRLSISNRMGPGTACSCTEEMDGMRPLANSCRALVHH